MGKFSNILTMLELLSNGQKYSIKELSERLEVTNRMIRVYKEELEIAGIYIDTIRGPYGGYVLNNSSLLPPRNFSKYDIDLLKNINNLVKDRLDKRLQLEYNALIDKVQGLYQGTKKKSNNMVINDDEKEKYNVLSKAIKEKRKVLINFLSADGITIERIIHPSNIYLYNDSWYVATYCELRSDMRHFRLARIIDYKLLDQKY